MRKFIRQLMSVFVIGLVATQFINCSQKEDDGGLYGSTCEAGQPCSMALSVGTSQAYLNPRAPPIMECNFDHVQIAGSCETDGAADNYIEYFLKQGENRVPFSDGQQVLQTAKCENGHYYMVIPRPPVSIVPAAQKANYCNTSLCLGTYEVHANLFTIKKKGSQFDHAAASQVIQLSIQYLIQSANGSVGCP